ncbi:MAG: SGNH hydrolase domain-containing protein [Actinomycetes bacterium]|jgi:SGNH domain (fused to AT3 domains)
MRKVWLLLFSSLLVIGFTNASADVAEPIAQYQFPALIDQEVPEQVYSKLNMAAQDVPKPYTDRCHTQQNLTQSIAPCTYGNLKSKTTIVLFGDSHALSWFPAIERLAIAKKWRLLSLTMSSCWPADIPAWNSTTQKLMTNCKIWRTSALKRITQEKPYLIFVAGTKGFSTLDAQGVVASGDDRLQIWQSGMARTFISLTKASAHIVYIGDTPSSLVVPPICLKNHSDSILACATPVTQAISESWLTSERDLAQANGAIWLNPTEWICNTDPCSPIVANFLIYRDGGHITASFSKTLETPLWQTLSAILATSAP